MDEISNPVLLNEIFNAHLVNEGLRRAYLKSPATKDTIIEEILKRYPKLKLSHERRDSDGKLKTWWLSKRKIRADSINTAVKIGRVLGYRNRVPIDKRDWNSGGYMFRIKARTEMGVVSILQASDAVLDFKPYYEDLAKKFEKSLTKMPIYGKKIKKVFVEVENEYSYEEVIYMMSNYKKKYKQDEGLKRSITKYMPVGLKEFLESLDLDNELHRGIIIGLRSTIRRGFMDKIIDSNPYEEYIKYKNEVEDLIDKIW